jgi:hypothetical protein
VGDRQDQAAAVRRFILEAEDLGGIEVRHEPGDFGGIA